MTSLLDGAKKLVSRGTDIGTRVAGLDAAVRAARGRLDDSSVDAAAEVVGRASSRLRLSANHTVVGIAGATGSGKSSTFNALSGLELAAVGVRRPTTSWAMACVWGTEGAPELLEWLGIPQRHQVTRDSMLDTGHEDKALQGVVLLDLPDHDSTEVSHHLEVDRLVKLADVLVWVLDPQKYADAAIHDRYLKPLATHKDVMLVVLNHIDTVPENRRDAMVDDVRRLLDDDGLVTVPIVPISARHSIGVDTLKDEIARRSKAKKATKIRLEADLRQAATRLQQEAGGTEPRKLSKDRIAELEAALADAAGVPTVVDAVEKSTRLRANRSTGWPAIAWFTKLKPDPLRRLHLNLGSSGKELTSAATTSVPEATQVQRARVDAAVRGVADDVSEGLAKPWATAVRKASVSNLTDITDRLDRTVSETDLGADKLPVWAGLVRFIQWVLILSAIAGVLWLTALFVFSYLQMDAPETPSLGPVPVPALLLVGGVLLGWLLAFVCRWLVSMTARSRARIADRRLRSGVHLVAEETIVKPIDQELQAFYALRNGLSQALL